MIGSMGAVSMTTPSLALLIERVACAWRFSPC
jgi:hypothetical protein